MGNPLYDSYYYQSGNYENYLQRSSRYNKLTEEIEHLIQSPILDFGCGVGFVVKSLENRNIQVQGYDISSWAVKYGKEILGVNSITNNIEDCKNEYGGLLALDVLEHMTLEEIVFSLRKIKFQSLLVRIPVAIKMGGDFLLDVARNDKTHITCLTKSQWEYIFLKLGFDLKEVLNYETIWDSEGVLSRFYVKRY